MTTSIPDLTMATMFLRTQTIGTVLCCICGEGIPPNPSNMCVRCMRSRTDITSSLPRQSSVTHCPHCSTYLQPPCSWLKASPESKELLSILLSRLKKPLSHSYLRLIHAEFVWTEPHSKRIEVKLRVQGDISNGAILEQSHVIEFVVYDRLCDSCTRAQANPDQWVAKVQLRQHVSHCRTFFYVEQLILKHRIADKAIRIAETEQGVDFMFRNRSHAVKFVEFLTVVVPVTIRSDKSLVSHDSKNNTYNYHHTFSVQICPICREDLICLPPTVAGSLGNLGPIVICTKVTNSIALMDPFSLRTAFLDAKVYWRAPFKALLSSRQLVEYIVLDVKVESLEVNVNGSKYCSAQAQVARVSDFGKNDNMFTVRTHLGHLLKPGDYAVGYDLYGANGNDVEIDKYKGLVLPEAILIKKSYEEKRQRKMGKAGALKLKSSNMEVDTTTATGKHDAEEKSEERETPDLRFGSSSYQDKEDQPSEVASTVGGDDVPSVPIDELADLDLSDRKDGDVDMALKLKSSNMEVDTTTAMGKHDAEEKSEERDLFFRDSGETQDLRFGSSSYQDKEDQPSEVASTVGGDDVPSVPIDELADLDLSDRKDSDVDSMME